MDKWDKIFLWILALSVVAVIAATAYKFLFAKDYDFVLEAPCDPSTNTCFTRDCSNPDDCPPNGLENYRIFNVKASDFGKCADNSCLNECLSGKISCTETKCGESEEDACSAI
jgi:hypothetical protein